MALGELQPEMMAQQAVFQVEQPGGHGGGHAGIYPGARSISNNVSRVLSAEA
jgi:hypothetical protein